MARIAILEDDTLLRSLLSEILSERGHEISEFETLAAVRRSLEESLPDLLITDVKLPDGNGLDLVAWLRQRHPESAMPVLVLSGLGGETDFMAGFAAGATDYLTKPLSNSELLAKTSLLLARSHGRPAQPAGGGAALPGGPDQAFGRYAIQKTLGQGTSGTVFLARDLQQRRDVALKVLHPLRASQSECRQRFLRESYTLSLLRSPYVVEVLDFGVQEGRPYFAMDWVSGPTLADRVAEQGPLSEGEVIVLTRGLAEALSTLAQHGLVHRDIKPANVLLRDGRADSPVLVDFGLAKRTTDDMLTRQGDLLGTPAYMSPECILGQRLDARSDLFSLGLVASYAASGREAFPDCAGLALLRALATRPIRLPDMSPPVRQILKDLTRVARDQRIGSARELQHRLAEAGTSLALDVA